MGHTGYPLGLQGYVSLFISSSVHLSNQTDLVRQRYRRWSPKNYTAGLSSYPPSSDTQVSQDTRIILQANMLSEVCLLLLPSISSHSWLKKESQRV
jgi:hypothetical protein